MRIGLYLAAAGLLLSGCATGPTGQEVLALGPAPKKSRLVMYRISALGLAVQPPYTVDGRPVAPSSPDGFVVCDLNPGPHQVAVGNMPINVNIFGGSDKAGITLRPGQTAYLKADPQPGLTIGVITLTEVTENQGRADTASLHKVEGSCI
jgi:hypothetical protein